MKSNLKSNSWKFHVTAPIIEIDWDNIAADLSRKNPIAFVKVSGENYNQDYVVVNQHFMDKAVTCDEHLYTYVDGYSICIERPSFQVYGIEQNQRSSTIFWAKAVKKAEYPGEYRNKGKVVVELPSV